MESASIALAAPGAELAARLGVEPIMVRGSHEAMLTHPDDVATALLEHITSARVPAAPMAS
ncbi:hypothetical protein [Actinoplanes sp. NPDC089786]|uniref:hypothetical protein n=1 Tax=Actinoplanes sp. NPDC089786 TaxID=3155185 RepID=UPI0034344ADB